MNEIETRQEYSGHKKYDVPLIAIGLICAYSLAVGYCMDPTDDIFDARPAVVQQTIDDALHEVDP